MIAGDNDGVIGFQPFPIYSIRHKQIALCEHYWRTLHIKMSGFNKDEELSKTFHNNLYDLNETFPCKMIHQDDRI